MDGYPMQRDRLVFFYNEVLKNFYQSFWPYCPHAKTFFIERNRRWSWKKKITALEQQIMTFKSMNPAYAGRYLIDKTYKPLKNLLNNLDSIKEDLDTAMSDIKIQDDFSLMFSRSGLSIISWQLIKASFF